MVDVTSRLADDLKEFSDEAEEVCGSVEERTSIDGYLNSTELTLGN